MKKPVPFGFLGLFFSATLALNCTQTSTAVRQVNTTSNSSSQPTGTEDSVPSSEQPSNSVENKKSGEAEGQPKPVATTLEAGDLNVQWIHGSANCGQNADVQLQMHAYNKNLTLFRQNKCSNYEAPFIYLLFGTKKALVIDTGAVVTNKIALPLQQMVEAQLVAHYGAAERAQIQLIVAHSHGHGDHRANDAQFAGKALTTVVDTTQPAVASFFAINNWPEQIVDFDLGGRVLNIIPIPGHEPSSIAIYDAQTGLLFSGDTLYPGRLYVTDWAAFRASAARLAQFIGPRPLTYILGAHIEMSKTAGVDYPIGTTFQPDEHVLPLKREQLIELDTELKNIGPTPQSKVLNDFIISP